MGRGRAPLTSREPNLGGVHHWRFFRWYARDGVYPTGARLIAPPDAERINRECARAGLTSRVYFWNRMIE
jgi:hypothetical protein